MAHTNASPLGEGQRAHQETAAAAKHDHRHNTFMSQDDQLAPKLIAHRFSLPPCQARLICQLCGLGDQS